MATYIKTLLEYSTGDTIYPKTKSDAVYRTDNVTVAETTLAAADTHIANTNNPHNVTATQLNVYTKTEIDNAGYLTSIPQASSSVLGGIKIGSGLTISSGGVVSVSGGGVADSVAWGHITGTLADQTDLNNILGTIPTNVSDLPNDAGYITGITSSDVTSALGYTPYNSTNPNGYTTNTGTVTKVTAGTGLKIGTASSGGDITTSGTINHINSVTAQTTQAVYPIKIDAQGHISAYGSAVSIPTKTSDLTNDSGFITSYIDTKNTAGSTNSDSKLYLIGATAQDTNPQTYSNSKLYFDNGLYSSASTAGGNVYSTISQSSSLTTVQTSSNGIGGSVKISLSNGNSIKLSLIGAVGTTETEYISVNYNGNVIVTGLTTPTNNTDAATKKYVDDSLLTIITKSSSWSNRTSPIVFKGSTNNTGTYLTSFNYEYDYDTPYRYEFLSIGRDVSYSRLGLKLIDSLGTTTLIANSSSRSSSNPIITLPDKTGTLALVSDIPTVPTNISAFTNDAGYITSYTETDPIFSASAASGITSSDITNWNSKTSNTGTVTSVRVQATSPVQSSTSTAQSTSLNTTISLANAYGDTKNPYGTKTANYVLAGPTSGSASAPSFRALVAGDIPDLSSTYATKSTTLSGYGITDAKISNGTITLGSNTITPLTSFTETDPVFSASAASGITSSDITNWNGKVSSTTTAKIFVQSATPTGMQEGDIWIDIS